MINLRVRSGDGTETVSVAEDGDPLAVAVARALDITAEGFELFVAFPPQPLADAGAKTPRELGVKDGTTLILRFQSDARGAKQGTKARRPRRAPASTLTRTSAASSKARRGRDAENGDGLGKSSSKQDVAEKLIAAFQGGPRDNVSTFLRRASRQAVISQYEIRAGNDRLAAALSGTYTVKRKGEGTAHGVEASVEYTKGSRGAKATDEIKLLSPDALRATLRYLLAVDDPEQRARVEELLRPAKMAEVSAATFWSLAEYCTAAGASIDLDAGLRRLEPAIDWSFLASRRRTKSDKALQAEDNAAAAAALAAERKRKRERKAPKAAAGHAAKSAKMEEQRAADSARAALIAALGGKPALASALAVESIEEAADLDAELVRSRLVGEDGSLSEESADEMAAKLRKAAITLRFQRIINDPELVMRLEQERHGSTPFDLVRLRVPGRVEFLAGELGLEPGRVRAWQTAAKEMCDAHPWMQEYRTVG
mmetsp:Transcript_11776/g.37746  ORF Transcript_11776/g.37746 Transcript_11776/m.37746 type:complete len:483 (-) Transcript_11776:743-2191(-)